MKKLTSGDKWKIFGILCTFVAGLWLLWTADLSSSNPLMHIKFFYSLFLGIAIAFAVYILVLQKEDKKRNGKK
jgi:cytosine/uracil/thiamine/allantoin permease